MQRVFDIDNWPRRSTFELFRQYEDPFFNITAPVDVTQLYSDCRSRGLAFSLSALHATTSAANEIREFRLRLVDDTVIEFDKIHATQTILNDDDSFSFCYFEWQEDLIAFESAGRVAREKYGTLKTFDVEADRLDLIYYSVIPWISFTSFKHANRSTRSQSVPRIVFGKLFDDGGRKKMPLSVEVNHCLMDGLHVGRFFELLQQKLDAFGS